MVHNNILPLPPPEGDTMPQGKLAQAPACPPLAGVGGGYYHKLTFN